MGEAKELDDGLSQTPAVVGSHVGSQNAVASEQPKQPTSSRSAESPARKKALRWLFFAASVYAVWFLWLLYVAWVNVSAGNR
ncbi:MAG: hypothetical protein AB8B50_12220 [Pirellulaceae bacterium]